MDGPQSRPFHLSQGGLNGRPTIKTVSSVSRGADETPDTNQAGAWGGRQCQDNWIIGTSGQDYLPKNQEWAGTYTGAMPLRKPHPNDDVEVAPRKGWRPSEGGETTNGPGPPGAMPTRRPATRLPVSRSPWGGQEEAPTVGWARQARTSRSPEETPTPAGPQQGRSACLRGSYRQGWGQWNMVVKYGRRGGWNRPMRGKGFTVLRVWVSSEGGRRGGWNRLTRGKEC